MERDEDDEVASSRTFFEEGDEVVGKLDAICEDMATAEWACHVLDKYQEQPQLLDGHLPRIMGALVDCFRRRRSGPLPMPAFRVAYVVVKVRGPKNVATLFGHEVSDVEPTVEHLQRLDPRVASEWEARYILLIWLSMAMRVPFSLATIDGLSLDDPAALANRVYRQSLSFLAAHGRECDGAAALLARLLSRRDVLPLLLPSFLDHLEQSVSTGAPDCAGCLAAICALLKIGSRADLAPYMERICGIAGLLRKKNAATSTLRAKLFSKLVQRIGLALLPPRSASWKYARGGRFIAFGGNAPTQSTTSDTISSEPEDDYDVDNADELEGLLDTLLSFLRHRDTIVRWGAAKGIGRLTERLPRALASDVVAYLLDLFRLYRSDANTLHGACLAVAELARRGALLTTHLPTVLPLLTRALLFDVRVGASSVGANVRDAACYTAWAFARAYAAAEFAAPTSKAAAAALSTALVTVALFDREVNCRRAAAAALQEHVGRVASVPHGIELITLVDYVAVGSRARAAQDIAPVVARWPEYGTALAMHAADVKSKHWDKAVRLGAAGALRGIVPADVDLARHTILHRLYGAAFAADPAHVHGALVCLGSVLQALAECGHVITSLPNAAALSRLTVEVLASSVRAVQHAEVVAEGIVCYIGCLARAGLSCENEIGATLQLQLEAMLLREEEGVRTAALDALCQMLVHATDDCVDATVERFVRLIDSSKGTTGAPAALPLVFTTLPRHAAHRHMTTIVSRLVTAASVPRLVERCRASLTALTHLSYLPEHPVHVPLTELENYTTDHRGDVGSWCREASMRFFAAAPRSLLLSLDASDMSRLCDALLLQLLDRIDRVRAVAVTTLCRLLYREAPVYDHAGFDALRSVLPADLLDRECVDAKDVFDACLPLLHIPHMASAALTGVAVICTGGSGATEAATRLALTRHLSSRPPEDQQRIVSCLASLLALNENHARLALPLLALTEHLVLASLVDVDAPPAEALARAVASSIGQMTDVKKTLHAANVLAWLAVPSPPTPNSTAGKQLVALLGCPIPRVRAGTARALYGALQARDVVDAPAAALLADVDWTASLATVRRARDGVCAMLGLC